MKIQLDLNSKTIKIEESVNLGEFVKAMKKLFPNDEWKDFKVDTNTVINNWNNPIIIDRFPSLPYVPVYPQPYTPTPFWWQQPTYICGTGSATITNGSDSNTVCTTTSNNVYNLEITNSN